MRFGTDHERFLGSGIVTLSQIAQVSEPVRFECQQEQKKLKELFKREKCEPWRKEYRLRADISRSTWENGDTGNLARHGPYDFPVFQFEEEVSITGNVALLEVARSDPAWGLMQFFRNTKLGEPWWVVDFFNTGASISCRPLMNPLSDIIDPPNSGLKSQHEAVRMLFSAETQKAEASNAQHILKEKPHVLIAADTVIKTAGVADAFRALTRLPEMWKTKSFQYLTDVRRCWCDEEVENYIRAIYSQWEQITLQWNTSVVPHVDMKSIRQLKSRAPCFSERDRDFVKDEFQKKRMLPRLKDATLRNNVEAAICRQGPILTLETFAQDVRLLYTRVHQPMTSFVDKMKRSENPTQRQDTLRKRVCEALGREFDDASLSLGLLTVSAVRKEAIIERCYQYAFLHAIRTAPPKGSVTQAQLSDLVKQELRSFDVQRGSPSLPNDVVYTDPIEIRPSDDVAVLKSEVFEVQTGHGISLFRRPAAIERLYYDRIHRTLDLEAPLTQADMVSHIVRIFLLGQAPYDGAQTPSSRSPASAQRRASPTRDRLPFDESSSNSLCISSSTDATSSPLPYLYTERAPRPEEGDVQAATPVSLPEPDSGIISSVETQRSRTTSMSTTSSTKRPLSATATRVRHIDSGSSDTAAKRPCLRESADEHCSGTLPSAAQLRLWTGTTTPDTRRHGVCEWGDLEASKTAQDSICAASTMGSSIYSTGTCILSNMDPVRPSLDPRDGSFNDFALDTPNPFRQTDSPYVSSSRGFQSQWMENSSDLLVEKDTATPVHWLGIPSTKDCSGVGVLFSNLKPGTGYQFPATKITIERFFANQKDLDEDSTFEYLHLGQKRIASDAGQLKTAILYRGARDIFVRSPRLASTDVPMPDN